MADVVMQKKAKGKHLNVNDLEQFKTARNGERCLEIRADLA